MQIKKSVSKKQMNQLQETVKTKVDKILESLFGEDNKEFSRKLLMEIYESTPSKNLFELFLKEAEYNNKVYRDAIKEYTLSHCPYCEHWFLGMNEGSCSRYDLCYGKSKREVSEMTAHKFRSPLSDMMLVMEILEEEKCFHYSTTIDFEQFYKLSEFYIGPETLFMVSKASFEMADMISRGMYITLCNNAQKPLIQSLYEDEDCYMIGTNVLVVNPLLDKSNTVMYLNGETGEIGFYRTTDEVLNEKLGQSPDSLLAFKNPEGKIVKIRNE